MDIDQSAWLIQKKEQRKADSNKEKSLTTYPANQNT